MYYIIAFDSAAHVLSLRSVSAGDSLVTELYDFVRQAAAYILLNDLMASDTVIPRRGCSLALQFQIGAAPEVLKEVQQDLETPPEPDPTLITAIQAAYSEVRVSASKAATEKGTTAENLLTRATLRDLGSSPTVTLIYRDQDTVLQTGKQYVIAKLQEDASRAYVMLLVDASGNAQIGVLPLCLVGDSRCAPYYLWP